MEVRRLPPADYFLFPYYVQSCSHAFAWPRHHSCLGKVHQGTMSSKSVIGILRYLRTASLGRKLLCLWADVAKFVAVRKNEAEVCEPL
jgi:hypothetical protein